MENNPKFAKFEDNENILIMPDGKCYKAKFNGICDDCDLREVCHRSGDVFVFVVRCQPPYREDCESVAWQEIKKEKEQK